MLHIFTDTDTDITPQIAALYNIDLISMPYIIDSKIIYPYKDFKEFKAKEFYDLLRSGIVPTTCALNVEEYKNYFEPIFAKGDDIFYIHFSRAMSASFNYMDQAIQELLIKYPNRKFYSLDSKAITIGSYNFVRAILDMLKNNSLEETIKWGNENVNHFVTYFYADDLKFFKKSGRVSGLAATMGSIIGIKPIIYIDENGIMKNVGKEKGRKNAVRHLVECVLNLGDDVKNHRIVIGHTDALELANELKNELIEKLGDDLNIDMVMVNPTAGSHCGPNGVGVSFFAKHR